MALSDDGRQEAYAERSDAAWIVCLTFAHDSLDGPLRFCDDNVTMTRTVDGATVTFAPYDFQVAFPGEDPEQPTRDLQVMVEDPEGVITAAIRGLRPAPTLTIEAVTSKDPDTVERGPYTVTLKEREVSDGRVVGTFGFEDILADAFPATRFTPRHFPGLFA